MDLCQRLEDLKLIVVTGKGGTGKSVMTAALGRQLALRGRRTLMLEVDPRENLHQLCGVPPSGGEIVEIRHRLYLQNLKPQTVVDMVVKRQVKVDLIVEGLRKSAVYQRFTEGAPGLTEIAILGHVVRLVARRDAGSFFGLDVPAIDTVVLDAPATGHGIYLLTAARLFADAIGEGPFAAMAREVAELVEDPDRAGLVVVTLAEEMPVQEAIELRAALVEHFGRPPELLIVNGLYPEVDGDGEDDEDDELVRLWHERRAINDLEIERLARRWSGPRIEVPLLAVDDPPHLVRLAREILDGRLSELEPAGEATA